MGVNVQPILNVLHLYVIMVIAHHLVFKLILMEHSLMDAIVKITWNANLQLVVQIHANQIVQLLNYQENS